MRTLHHTHTTPSTDASRRLLLVVFLLVVGVLLTSCFGGSSPQRTYYTIQYPPQSIWRYEAPRYPIEVRVTRMEADAAYDRQEMVYRSNPHEFKYYYYRLWSAKPRKMMREVVHRHLRQTNLFRSVTLEIDDRLPDFDLEIELLAIEELNADQETWFAHLSMRFALKRFSTGSRVWEYSFDERREVYNREPVYVVRAMSELAEDEISKAFEALDTFMAAETGLDAPPGGPGVVPANAGDAAQSDADEDGGDTGTNDGEGAAGDDPNEPKATLKNRR